MVPRLEVSGCEVCDFTKREWAHPVEQTTCGPNRHPGRGILDQTRAHINKLAKNKNNNNKDARTRTQKNHCLFYHIINFVKNSHPSQIVLFGFVQNNADYMLSTLYFKNTILQSLLYLARLQCTSVSQILPST